MFELQRVSKRYAGQVALEPLDLTIRAGTTTVLLGESGSGKSTLLKLLVGLVAPDTGTLRFEGRPLGPDNLLEARRRMGYVIQEGGLFPHMTVRANVSVMARYLGQSAGEIERRLAELVALVKLAPELLGRYPSEISGGQRQRVSLMRALMLDPDVLLLDEPLGALDPVIRYGLQQELKSIFERLGKTVVMVTHDVAEAACFADRVVMMRHGRVLQVGTVGELAAAPADPYVREFIDAQREPFARLMEDIG